MMVKLNGCFLTGKVSTDIRKGFDSRPVYNNFFSIIKIKSSCHEVAGFYDKEMPKICSDHTCLAVITIDSALEKRKTLSTIVFTVT